MTRALSLAALAALAAPAGADDAVRFKWQVGQLLAYRVEQSTTSTETLPGDKNGEPNVTTTAAKTSLTKRWQVTAVDPDGTATLAMTIAALRMETRSPSGETVFDSEKPGAGSQMGQ